MLDAYASTRPLDPSAAQTSRAAINTLVVDINRVTANASSQKEKYVVQPHLHDLQEANLHKTQHRLVISEIAQFPEHVMKQEREKMCELQAQIPTLWGAPSRPKMRGEGGAVAAQGAGMGKGVQGYNKPVDFVREQEGKQEPKRQTQTDEELEVELKEECRHDEEELREQTRILTLECVIAWQQQAAESEMHERVDLHAAQGSSVDATSTVFEQEEAVNLARESEDFLARQMDEMQVLAEEQGHAGLLLLT
ncbi:hypothetical protein B0H14DRAFT_3454552 [Mycena olivaceomarginata]|nr:hypothetical protein B0H14DRAFT_3454552 [Mycena olivaceomarginata]